MIWLSPIWMLACITLSPQAGEAGASPGGASL